MNVATNLAELINKTTKAQPDTVLHMVCLCVNIYSFFAKHSSSQVRPYPFLPSQLTPVMQHSSNLPLPSLWEQLQVLPLFDLISNRIHSPGPLQCHHSVSGLKHVVLCHCWVRLWNYLRMQNEKILFLQFLHLHLQLVLVLVLADNGSQWIPYWPNSKIKSTQPSQNPKPV